MIPPRSRSRQIPPAPPMPEEVPVKRPRGRPRKAPPAPPMPEEVSVPRSRSVSHNPPPAPDMPDVIPARLPRKTPPAPLMPGSIRLKIHKARGKHAAKAAEDAPAPESAAITKIAQVLAPDVLMTPKASPMRQPKMAKIPEAPPQGKRAMKVQKVNLKGPSKLYADLFKKNVAKVNLKKHLTASLQEINKQAQLKRRVPDVQLLHDMRMPIAVA